MSWSIDRPSDNPRAKTIVCSSNRSLFSNRSSSDRNIASGFF
jgi:hypothetical protein